MTAQPPGIRPSALRVATHCQQVASPFCRGAVGVFYSPSRQGEYLFLALFYGISTLVGYLMQILYIHLWNLRFLHEYCVDTILNEQEFIFLNMNK